MSVTRVVIMGAGAMGCVFGASLAESGCDAVLVDVRVTREENTYPMIPAGKPARDMVG